MNSGTDDGIANSTTGFGWMDGRKQKTTINENGSTTADSIRKEKKEKESKTSGSMLQISKNNNIMNDD